MISSLRLPIPDGACRPCTLCVVRSAISLHRCAKRLFVLPWVIAVAIAPVPIFAPTAQAADPPGGSAANGGGPAADSPEQIEMLEQTAAKQLAAGDTREADRTLSQLATIARDNPQRAMEYSIFRWHLRQEYAAQSILLRLVREGTLTAGNVALATKTLDSLYDGEAVLRMLRRENGASADDTRLRDVEAYSNGVEKAVREMEAAGAVDALAEYLRSLPWKKQARSYYSLWQGYGMIYRQSFESAEAALNVALENAPDKPAAEAARDGIDLIARLHARGRTGGILDRLGAAAGGLSSTVEGQFAGQTIDERLDELETLARRRDPAAAAIADSVRNAPMDDETRGRYFYLLGEMHWYRQEFFRADQSYVAASLLTRQRFILSAALFQMAEFASMSGRREEAADYASRSAGALQDQDWKLRQVGGFFIGLGMPERGIAYLEAALNASASPESDAAAYAALADAYNRIGDKPSFLRYAADYVAAVAKRGDEITDEEKGLRSFFQAELALTDGEREKALKHYEQAAELITERFRLADILSKMADLQAMAGNREKAVSLMERATGLVPDQDWMLRHAGAFLIRLGETEKGLALVEQSLKEATTSESRVASLAVLTDLYRDRGEEEKFLRAADEYASTVESGGYAASGEEKGNAAFYRGEIRSARGEAEQAFQAYAQASELVTEKYRLADIFMKMARYQAEQGDAGQAADLAGRSAAELPEEAWKQRAVGEFLIGLDLPDKAYPYLARYSQLGGGAGGVDALAAMADAYGDRNDRDRYLTYAQAYVDAVAAGGRAPVPEEEGLAAFYRGEILAAKGEPEQAYQFYVTASNLVADKGRLARIQMKMAEYQAGLGHKEQAATHAEASAAALPEEPWKLREVGDFLLRLDMPEKAFRYFERYAELSNPEDKAAVYGIMADAYRNRGDKELYLRFAGRYVSEVTAIDRPLTDAEQGAVAYYRAEILSAEGDADAAYREYERAAGFITDQYRLSEIHMTMALYQADRGNVSQAAALAEQAAQNLPDAPWRLRQIGDFFDRLNMPERAVAYFQRWLRMAESARDRAAAYSALAEIHKKMDDPEKYLEYARDYVTTVDAAGYAPSDDEKGWRFFYEGELLSAADQPDGAYEAYERASRFFTDKYRLSDIFIRMARYRAARGDKDAAVGLAEQSLALLPDEPWRIIEVGDLYNNLELPDKAVEQYRRAVELTPKSGKRASLYTSLAEVSKKLDDLVHYIEYARLYIDAIDARSGGLSGNEKGLRAFYQGEVLASEGKDDEAYRSFEEASELFTDKFRLSDIAMKQAEYHAKRENKTVAAELAEQSAALIPDQAWRQRGVGDFFNNLDMMDKAILYYERALELSKTPETRAAAFTSLAEAWKKLKNNERYLFYARQYTDAIATRGAEATAFENGQRAYYQGELYAAEKNDALAYQAYEAAIGYGSEDPYRMSELYIILSRYNIDWGNKPLAAEQAARAAKFLPDQDWRVGEAVDILDKAGRFCVAEALVSDAVALKPDENAHLYRKLSQLRLSGKDRKGALHYNAKFIDLLTDRVERLGCGATKEQRQELWNARDYQSGVSRTWGLDSYYFGRNWDDGNNFLGMSHELFRNYSLSNGMYGKVYAQYGGTLTAKYSGRYFMNNESYKWESRPNLGETAFAIFGANINPFKGPVLSSLSVNAEYYVGLGSNQKDDFRFRLGYDKTWGEKPRPFGNRWLYAKTYSNTAYSTRNNDVTSLGDFRLGATFVGDRDRDFLVMPHATFTYAYGGKSVDKGDRWAFEAGAGVAVRKWFRGGKYNTPRSYVDVQVYYQVGITQDRKDGFGFTLSTSF